MITTLELDDGKIIAEYDTETLEVLYVEDWHGNQAPDVWWIIAEERLLWPKLNKS